MLLHVLLAGHGGHLLTAGGFLLYFCFGCTTFRGAAGAEPGNAARAESRRGSGGVRQPVVAAR